MSGDNVTRTECELSLGWAQANPELFVKRVIQFKAEHPIEDWQHYIDLGGAHRMVLIANRRTKPYDPSSGDYLTEIGLN